MKNLIKLIGIVHDLVMLNKTNNKCSHKFGESLCTGDAKNQPCCNFKICELESQYQELMKDINHE